MPAVRRAAISEAGTPRSSGQDLLGMLTKRRGRDADRSGVSDILTGMPMSFTGPATAC